MSVLPLVPHPTVVIPSQRTLPAARRAERTAVDLELVIPAYNEALRLPATLREIVGVLRTLSLTARVVVVDNGSSDDTAAGVAQQTDSPVEVTVVGCAHPGKGAAVLRGLRTSRARWVGFADADLSTPVTTIIPAIAALQAGATAAIASRHAPGAAFAVKQPLGRRVGGTVFRSLARPLVPGVHDTQCGFKIFDREAAAPAIWGCRSTGFAFDVELLHRVQAAGGQIAEIPVTWTDAPGSTLRPVRDGVGAVLALSRIPRVAA